MNEEEMIVQEEETNPTETQTEAATETETTTTTTTTSESHSNSDIIIEALPENRENIIHELFYSLGVDLDYTPVNTFQCFTMALQFVAALWFIWHFVKFMWRLMIGSISIGR